jgi:hypothetical protein
MKISELNWKSETRNEGQDTINFAVTEFGVISVLDRMTGWGGGVRDVETGFSDLAKKFWLASGNFDIRHYKNESIEDAIDLIKQNANTCICV